MSYVSAVDSLYALGLELAPASPPEGTSAPPSPPRRRFDLEHMRVLSQALGDPHLNFPSVLIAGTNGKGSTAAALASILSCSGARTALYTSPHLTRVNERIQIGASPIADDDFASLYFRVNETARRLVSAKTLSQHPSFFEVLTAIAFLYFAEQRVEIAVLEVGLGGRLDATNIVAPRLSILTDIALDHQDYLGPTLAHIAREKCGILRPNGTLITLPQHPAVNEVIGEVSANLPNLRVISAAPLLPPPARSILPAAQELTRNRYTLELDGELLNVDFPLSGQHQQRNLALAIAAAVELGKQPLFNITIASIEAGIRKTFWPGRLEVVPGEPDLLLDVAHNPAGAWTLRAAIAQLPESRPRTLIFSCLRDKCLRELAEILFPLFDSSGGAAERRGDHILFAPISNPRATQVEDLVAAAQALDIPCNSTTSVTLALEEARRLTPSDGIILVTGSVYLVGEVRGLVLGG